LCAFLRGRPGTKNFALSQARTHHEMQCFFATTEGLWAHNTFEVVGKSALGRFRQGR